MEICLTRSVGGSREEGHEQRPLLSLALRRNFAASRDAMRIQHVVSSSSLVPFCGRYLGAAMFGVKIPQKPVIVPDVILPTCVPLARQLGSELLKKPQ
jgi:hypothetical protein